MISSRPFKASRAFLLSLTVIGIPLATPVGIAIAGPFEDGRAELYGRLLPGKVRDYAKAMRLLRPLAERGDPSAQDYVGDMYDHGWGVQQSSVQAAAWYRKAAEQGNQWAQNSLGWMYWTGDGVPKNYAVAMKWTLMAAKQGNWAAQSQMGSFYKLGIGVPQNYILAYVDKRVCARG
jgi:TPR repeat protein